MHEIQHKELSSLDLLSTLIRKVGQRLPQQNPMDQFVHNNLLMPFEEFPFWDGVEMARTLYRGRETKGLDWYLERWKKGEITSVALEASVVKSMGFDLDVARRWSPLIAQFLTLGPKSLAVNLCQSLDLPLPYMDPVAVSHSLEPLVWPLDAFEWLCRLAETYLDQGLATWEHPRLNKDFLSFACLLLKPFRKLKGCWKGELYCKLVDLKIGSMKALAEKVRQSSKPQEKWESRFLRLAFSVRGWSGMIYKMSVSPQVFLRPIAIDLADWLLILHELDELLGIDRSWSKDSDSQSALTQDDIKIYTQRCETAEKITEKLKSLRFFPSPFILKSPAESQQDISVVDWMLSRDQRLTGHIWHEAFEWTVYRKTLFKLSSHQRKSMTSFRLSESASVVVPRFDIQVLACMDDREESVRRYLEQNISPPYTLETYGVLGHFGVDMAVVSPFHPRPRQHCPPVVTPKRTMLFSIKSMFGRGDISSESSKVPWLSQMFFRHFYGSKTATGGTFSSIFLGNILFILLIVKGLMPFAAHLFFDLLTRLTTGRFTRHQENFSLKPFDHPIYGPCGFDHKEQADIVSGILRQAGLKPERIARLVVVMGHMSYSVNNPFQKAYGCGACSGNSGGINARVFASMFNNVEVRRQLSLRGILIPEDSVAVAAAHDTSGEFIEIFDTDNQYTALQKKLIEIFKETAEKALDHNAWERALPLGLREYEPLQQNHASAHKIRRLIQRRSVDLAQIRSEYGHARTYFAYFGPRSSTWGLSFERQSFLVSYDSSADVEGMVLKELLHGALPVVANITLDYFFSSLDTRGFGSHNKVPLNASAMIGLIQGSRGDLQIGLAEQMVEIHEPVRPMVFVEAPKEWILGAITSHGRLEKLVKNNWILLVQIESKKSDIFLLTPTLIWEEMAPWDIPFKRQ